MSTTILSRDITMLREVDSMLAAKQFFDAIARVSSTDRVTAKQLAVGVMASHGPEEIADPRFYRLYADLISPTETQ